MSKNEHSQGAASGPASIAPEHWQRHLEIIGAELFQRYRKRLMTPGIALEIWRDFPGLSLPDVMVRVYAGRRILEDGDDFRVLEAIRSGRWQRAAGARTKGDRGAHDDRVSRWLVRTGGLLFGVFCALTLLSMPPVGVAVLPLLGLAAVAGAGARGWRSRAKGRCGPGSGAARRRAVSAAPGGRAVAGPRDVLPSL
jgi:hypothetical protein